MALNFKDDAQAKKETKKAETAKAKAAVEAAAPVTEGANEVYGEDSDKLFFLGALADPSRPDKTPFTKPDGTKGETVTGTIVGYKFKASIDLDVPNVAPGDDLKDNVMSFTGDPTATIHVPAGQEFNLTKFETGVLISQNRFNARATGGDKKVVCNYAISASKKAGADALATKQAAPSIVLKALGQGESIKDWQMFDVLTSVSEEIPGSNGRTRKIRTLNEGYEKFAPLVKVAKKIVKTAAQPNANARNKNAEAFLNIIAQRARKV